MSDLHPLLEVSEFVRHHQRVAVVFDLDSTLFCVSPRTQAILRQLGNEPSFRASFTEIAAYLSSVEVMPSDYSVRQVMARTSFSPSPDLIRAVRDYWAKHFFSSMFLHRDVLYPSAREYVSLLHSLGANLFYLTGRPQATMRAGTELALRANGFPHFSENELLMKPEASEADEHFKVTELKRLSNLYEHIWFFENEPLIIREVRASAPLVHIVFVDSVHSGKAEAPGDLPTISPDYTSGVRS